MTKVSRPDRSGFAWLEAVLFLAVLILLLQLAPEIGKTLIWIVDVRNWPRTMWFAANLAILCVLVAVRFGPQLFQDWQMRRARLIAEQTEQQKQQGLKIQRKSLERMKQAHRRRIY